MSPLFHLHCSLQLESYKLFTDEGVKIDILETAGSIVL
jgi:hypothetical protein